jgi:hypothetical protein
MLGLAAAVLWTTKRNTSSRKSNGTEVRYAANFTAVWQALNGPWTVAGNWNVDGSMSVGESIGVTGMTYANGGITVPEGSEVILGGNDFSNLGFLSGVSELSHVGTLGGSPTAADCGTAINAILNQLTSNGFMF